MKATKEQFEEYIRCRDLGYFNMFDFTSWKNHTSLDRETWIDIITNFGEYSKMYGE